MKLSHKCWPNASVLWIVVEITCFPGCQPQAWTEGMPHLSKPESVSQLYWTQFFSSISWWQGIHFYVKINHIWDLILVAGRTTEELLCLCIIPKWQWLPQAAPQKLWGSRNPNSYSSFSSADPAALCLDSKDFIVIHAWQDSYFPEVT